MSRVMLYFTILYSTVLYSTLDTSSSTVSFSTHTYAPSGASMRKVHLLLPFLSGILTILSQMVLVKRTRRIATVLLRGFATALPRATVTGQPGAAFPDYPLLLGRQ